MSIIARCDGCSTEAPARLIGLPPSGWLNLRRPALYGRNNDLHACSTDCLATVTAGLVVEGANLDAEDFADVDDGGAS